MKSRLHSITQAVESPRLADIAVGYVSAQAQPPSKAREQVCEFLRHRLLGVAGAERSADDWANEVNAMQRRLLMERSPVEAERRAFAKLLGELSPFVARVSLVLAADMISNRRQEAYEPDLYEGEQIERGAALVQLSAQAQASGNLELAADFLDRASSCTSPETGRNDVIALANAVNERSCRPYLGSLGRLNSLSAIAQRLEHQPSPSSTNA